MKKKKPNPDVPLTQKEWDSMGPVMHGLDELPKEARAAMRRMGRPPVEHPKEKVTVRFDHDILVALRSRGKGWQTQLNSFIRDAIAQKRI